ncbi:MAG: methylmalonyl-CoA mutase [Myxococcales bacterium]|nr:MAG: methylmalonyl-CoA mutase [Myxococcales bacterium]
MKEHKINSADILGWQKLAEYERAGKNNSFSSKESKKNQHDPVYSSLDTADMKESMPGFFPYTRGIRATMYTHRPWTIRQYAGFSSAKASNVFYQECLKKGQKGLSVAFDLPTHRGYDSDNPLVVADVGKAGVAIDSVLDMQELFKDIDLSQVSVSMTMNGAVLPVLAAFIVAAEESGVSKEKISGTIQNDILKEFLVRNTFIYPPKPSMRIVADIIEYSSRYLPQFNSISISGYHIHEAGADLALELGLTLADGIEYVKAALDRGIAIDNFASRLSFFFATGMDFFMEVAKLRAARTIWAHTMKEFGAKEEKSLFLRTHCQTSGWSLAAKDPLNNVVRTTIEAMAAVLGGTQSLHTNSYDEAISLPTSTSSRIARNTQLILQHESRICDVVDPLGGSYYVEYLTAKIAKKARHIMDQIALAGGMTKALETGLPSQWIEEAALERQARIDSQQEVVVGVNKYQLDEEEPIEILSIDNHQVIKEQKEKLAQLKNTRNESKCKFALEALAQGAKDGKNLLELSINAMRNRASVGEVSEALEQVFRRFEPKVSSSFGVYKKMYDKEDELQELLSETKALAKLMGRQPRLLVAKLGQDGHDRGAKVIASAFADLGFDVDLSPLFQTPKTIAQQAIDNDVHVIGVSTLAAGHLTLVPELMKELKKRSANDILVVVGGVIPPQDYDTLKSLGVLEIFGPGTSVLSAAHRVLECLKARIK